MAKKDIKNDMLPPIRMTSKQKKELQDEADRELLDLTVYIRRLLLTDPRRKKKTT